MPAPLVVLDANVLYGSLQRDLYIRLGIEGVIRPHWTDPITQEWVRNLRSNRPELGDRILAIEPLMRRSLEMASLASPVIDGFATLINSVLAVHPGDRHVAAAALKLRLKTDFPVTIVTENFRHFPKVPLARLGLNVSRSDPFLAGLVPGHRFAFERVLRDMQRAMTHSRPTTAQLFAALKRAGLRETAEAILAWRGNP